MFNLASPTNLIKYMFQLWIQFTFIYLFQNNLTMISQKTKKKVMYRNTVIRDFDVTFLFRCTTQELGDPVSEKLLD